MAGCPPRRLGALWEATIVDVTFRVFLLMHTITIYYLFIIFFLFETGAHHIALSVLELTT